MRKFLLIVSALAAGTPQMTLAGQGQVPATPQAVLQRPQSASPERKLDPPAIVAEVRRIIAARYVLPERRPALDAALAGGLASGRYNVTDPATLAERINADLQRVGRDDHLGFSLDPRHAGNIAAQRNEAAPDHSGFERGVREANHGITELRLLPGNIRYMAYDGFMWMGSETEAALERAMRFLVGGEAIIIDLRRNGGGDADASQYLISHFMPANQALYTYFREGGQSSRVSTLAEVPAGRVIGKPLYVLTSEATLSAAEEFAGNVKGFRLGEVVGGNTAGGGHPNAFVPIDGRFVLSVSIGRVVLASTGGGWEGVGVAPTIPTAVPQALDAAHALALRRVAAKAPAEERARLESMADGIAARVEARRPALPLPAYAGGFGERAVRLDAGKLIYQFGERPRRVLVPLGGDVFTFEDDPLIRVQFIPAGDKVAALEVANAGGKPQGRYPRTQ